MCKNSKEMGYIYMLTSPSGKSYIGQAYRPIEKRLEEHRTGKVAIVWQFITPFNITDGKTSKKIGTRSRTRT